MHLKNTNIILIGMPSAGKTTIGKKLAKKLNRPFYDLDDRIVQKAGVSIPEIFKQQGESGFRKLEKECVKQLAHIQGMVLSTGGGTIKDPDNVDILKQNGILIFIDRKLDMLISEDPSRPLSSSKEAITKLYEERYPLYQQYADIVIENNQSKEDALNKMIQELNNKGDNIL